MMDDAIDAELKLLETLEKELERVHDAKLAAEQLIETLLKERKMIEMEMHKTQKNPQVNRLEILRQEHELNIKRQMENEAKDIADKKQEDEEKRVQELFTISTQSMDELGDIEMFLANDEVDL